MTPSFICGAEEPLRPNPQLTALDERSGQRSLAGFEVQSLCRYSFVQQVNGASRETFNLLLSRAALAVELPASWLAAWSCDKGASGHVRARVLQGKLKTAGWDTAEHDGLRVASRPWRIERSSTLAPRELDERIAGWAVPLGAGVTSQDFVTSPMFPSIAMMAITHRLEPSREFLAGLSARHWGIAYLAKDAAERDALVVVVPRPMTLGLERLIASGVLSEVVRGEAASRVWPS